MKSSQVSANQSEDGGFKNPNKLPEVIAVQTLDNYLRKSNATDGGLRSVSVSTRKLSMVNDLISEDDYCQGPLDKQSPSFLKFYQTRYFVLQKRMLYYYKNKDEYTQGRTPKGIINFQQVCVNQVFSDEEKRIELLLNGCDRKFILKCNDSKQF